MTSCMLQVVSWKKLKPIYCAILGGVNVTDRHVYFIILHAYSSMSPETTVPRSVYFFWRFGFPLQFAAA